MISIFRLTGACQTYSFGEATIFSCRSHNSKNSGQQDYNSQTDERKTDSIKTTKFDEDKGSETDKDKRKDLKEKRGKIRR